MSIKDRYVHQRGMAAMDETNELKARKLTLFMTVNDIATIFTRYSSIAALHVVNSIDCSTKLPLAAVSGEAVPSIHCLTTTSISIN